MSDVKLTDNSGAVLAELKSRVGTALNAIGAVAETHAKELTPVRTGRLRNSIAHKAEDDSVYIGTNVEYGPAVEFGTSRQKAHHMLKKAATEHSAEYKAIAKDILGG